MKTILLLAAAILLAAAVFVQTSVHSQTTPSPVQNADSIPSEYFTAGSLNGYLSTHATEKERRIYLLAYGDGARISISAEANIYYETGSDLKMPVRDVFESIFGRQIRQSRQHSCRDLGATPVVSVFYQLASDTYLRLRCASGPFRPICPCRLPGRPRLGLPDLLYFFQLSGSVTDTADKDQGLW
jgi:hypothetical protein